MRVLGLDLGSKTIGVAVSDDLGLTAQPVTVIRRQGQNKDLAVLAELVREYGVETVVLGLPRNMDGSLGPQAEKTEAFGRKIRERLSVEVVYSDERLSTVSAERMLIQADVSRAKRKKVIDKVAATVILQGFLDRRRSGRGPA